MLYPEKTRMIIAQGTRVFLYGVLVVGLVCTGILFIGAIGAAFSGEFHPDVLAVLLALGWAECVGLVWAADQIT